MRSKAWCFLSWKTHLILNTKSSLNIVDTLKEEIEGIIGARVGVDMKETVRAPAKVILGCVHERYMPFYVCCRTWRSISSEVFFCVKNGHRASQCCSKTGVDGSERGKSSMERVMTRTGTIG